jgi:alkylresorcinol/alkylpyrone synthase
MGWNVDERGFGVIFDQAIPPFAEVHIAPAIRGILGRAGLGLTDIDRFACHPGGAKVVNALERALSLGQGALDHERTVLADYGNMSAPTALFVLERVIQAGLPPRTLLTAMGPGFTASCVSLKRAAWRLRLFCWVSSRQSGWLNSGSHAAIPQRSSLGVLSKSRPGIIR